MTDRDDASFNPLTRVAGLVELVTSLDTRILAALDSLEEIRQTMIGFQDLGAEGDLLVADLGSKIQKLDLRLDNLEDRLHRDLDDVKAAVMKKIGDVDLSGFSDRFERLEEAVFNIERATTSMDRVLQGTVQALPDFMTRKVHREGHEAQENAEIPEPHGPAGG